jgi:tRNA(fMet)-specific endonuclease VapC
MSLFLLDTDTVTLLEQGHPQVLKNVNRHPVVDIAISAISVQEQMEGFLAAVKRARDRKQTAAAYDMLVTRLLPVWLRLAVLSFSEAAIVRFEHLRSLRLNVGSMDLRIAAVALENQLTVVTRNQRDFGRIPGVTTVDWST